MANPNYGKPSDATISSVNPAGEQTVTNNENDGEDNQLLMVSSKLTNQSVPGKTDRGHSSGQPYTLTFSSGNLPYIFSCSKNSPEAL